MVGSRRVRARARFAEVSQAEMRHAVRAESDRASEMIASCLRQAEDDELIVRVHVPFARRGESRAAPFKDLAAGVVRVRPPVHADKRKAREVGGERGVQHSKLAAARSLGQVERDSDGFMEWLGDFARDFGVEAMVADDLSAYKPAVERLGVDHQIRIAHVKKRARKRLDKIEGWDCAKARIWRLLTELPVDGGSEFLRLERAVRDGDSTFRRLCAELSGKRRAPSCHRRRRDVPGTNNVTERAISRSEIRYKTVKGARAKTGY